MIYVKCIDKFRDGNGKIFGYRLIDLNGVTQDVMADNLKNAIHNKEVNVVNLTLTSDGRLIDTIEKSLKNEKILGKPPVMEKAKDLGNWSKAYRALQQKLEKLLDLPSSCLKLEKRRINMSEKSHILLLAMALEKGNRPIIVMTPDEFYITDEHNTVKIEDEEMMTKFLKREGFGLPEYKKDDLNVLRKFVCDFAKKYNMGEIRCNRYDSCEDEDGFAIFISNYRTKPDADYRYTIKMDIAESGIMVSMDVKNAPFISYNYVGADRNIESLTCLMNYLVKVINNKILSADYLYILNGEIWDVVK